MSLLMKALEKAARDRDEAPASKASVGGASAAAQGGGALALEPVLPTPRAAAGTPAAGAAPANTPAKAAPTAAPPQPQLVHAGPSRTREQAQAATLTLAQRQPQSQIGPWMRDHPLVVFGTLAGLFLAGYGIYVYLQVAHPGLFTRQAPAPKPAIAAKAPPSVDPVPQSAPSEPPTLPGTLIPSSAILGKVGDTAAARDASAAPSPPLTPAPQAPSPAAAAPAPQVKPAAVPAAPGPPAGPREKIVVSRGDANPPRVNPLASEGYAALEAGRFEDAQRAYGQLARAEPNNIDALLGLAALAQRENKSDEAQRLYMKVLELDPRHAHAQSGLIAIVGRADPQSAESRLKQLAAREPSASIYFTLGNLYADQSHWAQAQQAYFQAHHLDPENPDYAYNLAVGLEHLGQHKLALNFYRRALQLAAARNSANFNLAQAQARISQLAARVE